VDQQVVLVPMVLLTLQQQQVELVVELIIVFHQQLDGEILVDLLQPEVLVEVAVVLVQWVALAQIVMLEMVVMDYRIVLVAHQQHTLVVEVEENSHQTQEEMLALVAPEAVVLVVKVLMPLMGHNPLEAVAVVGE
jgi:hypothetical protein